MDLEVPIAILFAPFYYVPFLKYIFHPYFKFFLRGSTVAKTTMNTKHSNGKIATCISSEKPSSVQMSSLPLETTITVLKRKRPRALTVKKKKKLSS